LNPGTLRSADDDAQAMTAAEVHTVLDALDMAGCWLSARAVAARSSRSTLPAGSDDIDSLIEALTELRRCSPVSRPP
jgi:hypothetical protein